MNYTSNPQLELAFDFIQNTNRNIFLTGKAGTGKTTFLHQLKEQSLKRMALLMQKALQSILYFNYLSVLFYLVPKMI